MESEKLTVGRIQQLTEGQTSEDFARNMKARGITVSGLLKLPPETPMISIPVAEHERLLKRAALYEALTPEEWGETLKLWIAEFANERKAVEPFRADSDSFMKHMARAFKANLCALALRRAIEKQEG